MLSVYFSTAHLYYKSKVSWWVSTQKNFGHRKGHSTTFFSANKIHFPSLPLLLCCPTHRQPVPCFPVEHQVHSSYWDHVGSRDSSTCRIPPVQPPSSAAFVTMLGLPSPSLSKPRIFGSSGSRTTLPAAPCSRMTLEFNLLSAPALPSTVV